MQLRVLAAALAAAGLAAAQNLDSIPACARQCLVDAVKAKTTCGDDIACACQHVDVIQAEAVSCVVDSCGMAVALTKVLPAVRALCKA